VAAETKFLIRASYLEIYNESIRDLLGKDVKATLDLKVRARSPTFVQSTGSSLSIAKEFVDKGVQVPGLTWHECRSVGDCERLMDKGNKSRATGATLMNKDSSRSHSIFTIQTEMCTRSDHDGKEHIRAGKLNLVDLAGSERQSKTRTYRCPQPGIRVSMNLRCCRR
jgi:kinesin family member 17